MILKTMLLLEGEIMSFDNLKVVFWVLFISFTCYGIAILNIIPLPFNNVLLVAGFMGKMIFLIFESGILANTIFSFLPPWAWYVFFYIGLVLVPISSFIKHFKNL